MLFEIEGYTFHHRDSWSDRTVINELWHGSDEYGVRGLEPHPKIVIDIGANIGILRTTYSPSLKECL